MKKHFKQVPNNTVTVYVWAGVGDLSPRLFPLSPNNSACWAVGNSVAGFLRRATYVPVKWEVYNFNYENQL